VKSQVDGSVSEGKLLISKTKDKYITTQQLVPIDISQQVSFIYSFNLKVVISSSYMKKVIKYCVEYLNPLIYYL
jgi:tRNA(Phe) wybutosine-synthesizing methylase Tyw3